MLIFRAVCAAGCNSTKAAEALHMTQPAVSLAVKELESYYGVRLFDRIGKRLQLTEAGRSFLRYAIHISDLFEDMERGLRDWDAKGLLRVGASITIGSQLMPNYVRAFAALYPETEVRVLVEQSDRLEKKLLANELDFALIEGVAHDPAIVSEAYMEDELCVVCPAGGPWEENQTMSLDDFARQRLLLREPGSGTREVFDRAMEQAGYAVVPVWEAMSTTALVNAVINGLGLAVLPRRMVLSAQDRGLVATVRVEGLDLRRSFFIIHHRDKYLTASALSFMALCRAYERDYPTPACCGLS
ncbi:MAG: LysR family transcriptional regulator [Clostridia bacterium]|nr:LysR family transcriptional regulator [Clostridia bacterium]